MAVDGKNRTRKLAFTGMMTALLAVLSILSIPLPSGVPITLQTFAVALCGFVLGPWAGTMAVLCYLALGAIGVPVFAGMTAGFGVLIGVTGGYLWSFLLMALLCGLGRASGKRAAALALGLAGLALCHVCGCLWFAAAAHASPGEAFLLASAPYLVKDVLSVAGAYLAAQAILFGLRKAGLAAE